MGIATKNRTKVAIEAEDTEGVYKAPASAASFVQTLAEGFEMSFSKDLIERNVFTGSIGKVKPRTGAFQVSGTVPVECRAHSTAGHAPEYDVLMKSAMGESHAIATTTTTKASGNTDSKLQIEDADISKFKVNDIILVKEAGKYHVSPIIAVDETEGAANVTLLIPRATGTFPNSVVIEKAITYKHAEEGHPSFSVSKYVDNQLVEKGSGCRVKSMALENFSTGGLPSFKFGFEGMNFDFAITAPPFTPSFDSALPPIVLDARIYMNGQAIKVNEMSLSMENTLGWASSISAENGRYSGRATERKITGSINPYKANDNIDNFTIYKQNQTFSLFAYAKNPTGVAGEFNQVVAIYMPACTITSFSEADDNGLLQDSIEFSASRDDGTVNELAIAFI